MQIWNRASPIKKCTTNQQDTEQGWTWLRESKQKDKKTALACFTSFSHLFTLPMSPARPWLFIPRSPWKPAIHTQTQCPSNKLDCHYPHPLQVQVVRLLDQLPLTFLNFMTLLCYLVIFIITDGKLMFNGSQIVHSHHRIFFPVLLIDWVLMPFSGGYPLYSACFSYSLRYSF